MALAGQYLLRVEQIALHLAETYQGAQARHLQLTMAPLMNNNSWSQFYLACAQLNVVNGGSGKPSPTVAIPGVYTGYEPGILIVSSLFVTREPLVSH